MMQRNRRKSSSSSQQQQQSAPSLRRKKKNGAGGGLCGGELLATCCVVLLLLVVAACGVAYEAFFSGGSSRRNAEEASVSSAAEAAAAGGGSGGVRGVTEKNDRSLVGGGGGGESIQTTAAHLHPKVPVLPIFAPVPNSEALIENLLDENNPKPTMAGIVALMQKFIHEFHKANQVLSHSPTPPLPDEVVQTYFDIATTYLGKFDEVYRGRTIFPVRDDDSIFLSLAAYREHLLADTMINAFQHAKNPDKLFVGAVVQNCFGKVVEDENGEISIDPSGLPCRTGVEVVGKNKQGKDMTKVSDAPPDKNGIEEFCNNPHYKKYCDSGQVRVLYVYETESVGPAAARYAASKLWGGETYFMQCDSHLMFAKEWDDKYIKEVHATRNYPKSVLSSYPPGFQNMGTEHVHESSGARLCTCDPGLRDPNPIIRINVGRGYSGNEPRPTQIPFIAAGFFFAHAKFLVDVPFDPYLPWLFMGEEIALSMRAWTNGWDIYAPRKNLIAHQYRPGRMGLPKFWESVTRLYHDGSMNSRVQRILIKRIKYMVGYPDAAIDKINAEGINFVLKDIDQYGVGSVRSWDDYMEFASMHVNEEHDVIDCTENEWCNKGLKD